MREVTNLATEIPKLEKLIEKPFVQEAELQAMKAELAGMERQIAITIQENQLKQQQDSPSNGDTIDIEAVEIATVRFQFF